MRWSVTFLAVVGVAAIILLTVATQGPSEAAWPLWPRESWVQGLKAIVYISGFLIVLWGASVQAMGGKEFYAGELAWTKDPKKPLDPVGPAVPVQTGVVLACYRPELGAYGRFARGAARAAGLGSLLVLAYAVTMISLDGSWGTAKVVLMVVIVGSVGVGFGWVVLIFARSKVLVHPDGVTLVGAVRKVVVSNSRNCVLVKGDGRTAMTDLGGLYIDRVTGRRCAIWESVFEIPGGLESAVREVAPRIQTRRRPSKDLAPYVSFWERKPKLALMLIVWGLVAALFWSARGDL